METYTKTVVFQTPTSIGSQSPYTNYVNVITNVAATKSTTFDNVPISGHPHMRIDDTFEVTRMAAIKAGAHIVRSDSACGVYIYGYGFDESYAWTGSFGTGTFNSPDTIAPAAKPNGSCFYAHVDLADTGFNQSLLNYIRLDSVYNMAYNRDDPRWIEGVGIKTSYYDMFVLDSTKEAILVISVFDVAGNRTTIVSSYKPQVARIAPPLQDFGVGNLKGPAIYAWDTIVNTGKVPYNFTDLRLAIGKDFNLDSAVTTPLAVGETRIIKISFLPSNPMASYDTILFGDACIQQQVLVYGTGGGADFRITNYNFTWVVQKDPSNDSMESAVSPVPAARTISSTHIINTSKSKAVVIDSVRNSHSWTKRVCRSRCLPAAIAQFASDSRLSISVI